VVEPRDLNKAFLTEDCEVIGSLLAGRHNHDLLVSVPKQDPEGKGSSNPTLTKTTKRLDLKTLRSIL
jgi:hypothetical protein